MNGSREAIRQENPTHPGVVSTFRIGLLAGVLFPLLTLCITLGVLRASAPPPAPFNVQPGPPFSKRLAERVLLVIVDGLRYDVGTDEKRMPFFARAMATRNSGEIWAGQVSMTSSAVMALGTGQRGQLEQVILNLHAKPAEQNTWLQNAKERGLRLMTVGDPAWPQFYSKSLETYRNDPEGVAIDVDFNPQTFANVRELLAKKPDFLVAHFVTPDHQGHAYRVTSERYTKHIHDFDRKLDALLSEVDPSFTVIVTSDHGAADSGTHGTDVAVQRKSPIYAYGPGIASPGRSGLVLDQLDLATTLPLLLGVSPPAHGTGRAIVEWLDESEVIRVRMACENARRVVGYAERATGPQQKIREVLGPCQSASSDKALAAAETAVRMSDAVVTRSTGLGARATHYWVLLIACLGALSVLSILPTRLHRWSPLGAAVIVVTVALVVFVERLPGVWPNVVRAALFVVGNAVLVALLLAPRWLVQSFKSYYPFTGLLPVVLAATYPADTRPEVVAVIVVVGLAYALFTRRLLAKEPSHPATRNLPLLDRLWLLVALAGVLPVALREGSTYSSLLGTELGGRLVSSVLAALFVCWFAPALRVPRKYLALLVVVLVTPIWVRQWVGYAIGRGAWLASIALVIYAIRRHKPAFAIVAAVAGLLWISRDFEHIPYLATLSVAWIIGAQLVRLSRDDLSRGDFILSLLIGFGLMFALRMGQQDGLDFGGMDWGAAAFNDPHVSATLVGVALVYKYAVGAAMVAYALSSRLAPRAELRLLTGLCLCLIFRVISLSGMFFFAGGSFWTALRVLGDLPSTAAMAFGSIVLLAARTVMLAKTPEPERQLPATA